VDLDRALETLEIKRVPYAMLSANASGYSYGRNLAISPLDESPLITALHEGAHILHGHTEPERLNEYRMHRGLYEFEAEATAYIVGHELDVITEQQASESRGYCQRWLMRERPPETSIRQVFKVADQILRAGIQAVPAS
jgi:hypothetical protein